MVLWFCIAHCPSLHLQFHLVQEFGNYKQRKKIRSGAALPLHRVLVFTVSQSSFTYSTVTNMGRGEIEIKKIEDPKNRQATFARRRKGLVKKAKDLSILCSAEVGVIIFSNPGKIYTYPNSVATIQRILERYQRMSGECSEEFQDVSVQSRRLQHELARLDFAVRHMMGEDLNFLTWNELNTLEDRLNRGVALIRGEKNRLMQQELETSRKRLENRCSPIKRDYFVEKAVCKEETDLSTPLAPGVGDEKKFEANLDEADAEYGINLNLELGGRSF